MNSRPAFRGPHPEPEKLLEAIDFTQRAADSKRWLEDTF